MTEKTFEKKDTKSARILIVDDHPIVREGLRRLIDSKSEGKLVVCGEVDNADDALIIIGKLRPDVVIVDVFLKSSDGIELVKNIRAKYVKLPILMLSMYDESLYAERALQAGADGYIMKQADPNNLLEAIHKVLTGEVYFSDKILTGIMRKMANRTHQKSSSSVESLSDRELEVFRLMGHGKNTRQISEIISISIKTIETYQLRIKEKLRISTINELIQHAVQWVNSKENK